MAQRADVIRHDIENTRTAMTVKLTMLEGRVLETVAGTQASVEKIMEDVGGIVKDVRGTVEEVGGIVQDVKATVEATLATVDTTLVAVRQGAAGTQAAVEEVVEYVKGGVAESLATVRRTFDVPAQVQQHPWPMVGGALLAGYLLGRWGGGPRSAATSPGDHSDAAVSRPGSPPAAPAASARPQPPPGIVSGMVEQFKDEMKGEMSTLKSVAVGAVVSTLRAMLTQAIPALAQHRESADTTRGNPRRP